MGPQRVQRFTELDREEMGEKRDRGHLVEKKESPEEVFENSVSKNTHRHVLLETTSVICKWIHSNKNIFLCKI